MTTTQLTKYTKWEDVPDHLLTKTSLDREGLKPAPGQRAVAFKRSGYDDYYLYDKRQAVPKRKLSQDQRQALQQARKSSLEARTCRHCGHVAPLAQYAHEGYTVEDELCPRCRERNRRIRDRNASIGWARQLLQKPTEEVVILDTETTGLGGNAEVLQIAAIDGAGNTLVDELVKPAQAAIEPGAFAVHGISDGMLDGALAFADLWPHVAKCLRSRHLVIYNSNFDLPIIEQSLTANGLAVDPYTIYDELSCAMLNYAAFNGQWHRYYRNYRWMRLTEAYSLALQKLQEEATVFPAHSAIGDCHRTLTVIRYMAQAEPEPEL